MTDIWHFMPSSMFPRAVQVIIPVHYICGICLTGPMRESTMGAEWIIEIYKKAFERSMAETIVIDSSIKKRNAEEKYDAPVNYML